MSAPSDRPNKSGETPEISVEPLRYQEGDIILDKYQLLELKGQGGMGSVWRAKNLALEVDVAVKLVHGEASKDSAERLQREAHAAARLEHASAVRVFDLGETELGDPFIVMELLLGKSLREYLEEHGSLAPSEAVRLMLPILSAMGAAHAKGIVHRDLKPENIMLVDGEDGPCPKVVDFGIAKVDSPGFDRRSTSEGTILGSPDYMAPEQARGEVDRIEPQSDVWALGVLLYELISGAAPFAADHPLAQLRLIIEHEPPTLSALGKADEKLSEIIATAMSKRAEDRYAEARGLGRAAAEWATQQGITTDIVGTSIATHWMSRGSRTSLIRDGLPSDTTLPGALVWSPKRTKDSRRMVAGLALGSLGLGLMLGAALYLGGFIGARSHSGLDATAAARAAPPLATPPAPIPTAVDRASPPASGAPVPSSSASNPPAPQAVDVGVCIANFFPSGAFAPDATLGAFCEQPDPRESAKLLRSEIARHGLVTRTTTAAMREWALLSWFELALVGTLRGACCSKPLQLELPPAVGTCPDLGKMLDHLAAAWGDESKQELALANFRQTVQCVERSHRINVSIPSPYQYPGPPGGGAESALRRMLVRQKTSQLNDTPSAP